jgi:hypothetical protein
MLEEGGSHDGRLVLMDFGAGRDRHVEDRGAEVAGTPL